MQTTKENVLLIAPELTTKLTTSKQIVKFIVKNVANNTVYSVTINGIVYSIVSAVTAATNLTITTQLCAAIVNAAVIVVNNDDGTFTITSVTAGEAWTYGASLNITSILSQLGVDGDQLFDLLLTDVNLVVTEDQYSTEQERGQRYLMAHLLTVHFSGGYGSISGVSSEKVGDVEYTLSSMQGGALSGNLFAGTKYGEIFYDIYVRHYLRFL